ncbi:MAG: hypothetical protein ACHQ49_03690 [Elusimicrobiota bacterium]
MKVERVYDGASFCVKCDHCPVVDHVPSEGIVVIHDPHRPENGRLKMTAAEFNALLANARPVATND